MSWQDRIYWLLSFPLGGFAAWLFDNTTLAPWASPYILGVMLGRMPQRVKR